MSEDKTIWQSTSNTPHVIHLIALFFFVWALTEGTNSQRELTLWMNSQDSHNLEQKYVLMLIGRDNLNCLQYYWEIYMSCVWICDLLDRCLLWEYKGTSKETWVQRRQEPWGCCCCWFLLQRDFCFEAWALLRESHTVPMPLYYITLFAKLFFFFFFAFLGMECCVTCGSLATVDVTGLGSWRPGTRLWT